MKSRGNNPGNGENQPSFYGKFMAAAALNVELDLHKPKNLEQRKREHLTEQEVNQLMKVVKSMGWHGHRDSTMILLAYRHGLRVSELVRLKWLQVDLFQGKLYVHSTHPLAGV